MKQVEICVSTAVFNVMPDEIDAVQHLQRRIRIAGDHSLMQSLLEISVKVPDGFSSRFRMSYGAEYYQHRGVDEEYLSEEVYP